MTALQEGLRTEVPTEVGLTLEDPAPRTMGSWDFAALWGNLGVSLLGFTGAMFVLAPLANGPQLSIAAALLALVVGTALGTVGFAAAGVAGSLTGAPSMVLMRGLFGSRASYLPTVLNVIQLVGWTIFELVTIGTALHRIAGDVPRWAYILVGGVITTALSLRPLGWIRVLRKYVTVAVAIALVYLAIQLLRHPLPGFTHGSWTGFWPAVDTVVGVSVSWVPLVADYSRHSRGAKGAFAGTVVGYSLTQFICYAVGLVAIVTVAQAGDDQIFGAFLAVPLGTLAFGVIALRELDQSFADTYSTVVSLQNFWPRLDRRALAVVVGLLATVCALALNIADYENFLYLIGSVFVPLLGVWLVDWFLLSRGAWRLDGSVRTRWAMLGAWVIGFAAYQFVNPGYIGWWARMWTDLRWFTPATWVSASLTSFVVSALAALVLGLGNRRRRA